MIDGNPAVNVGRGGKASGSSRPAPESEVNPLGEWANLFSGLDALKRDVLNCEALDESTRIRMLGRLDQIEGDIQGARPRTA
jgi:hypothetical protein